jgi:hypothetical protein
MDGDDYQRIQQMRREAAQRQKRSNLLWLGVGIGATIIGLLVWLGVPQAFLFGETTSFTADPRRFDPVAALDEVAAFAGDGMAFAGLEAHYVRADGTLDLEQDYAPADAGRDQRNAFRPHVRYFFLSREGPADNRPPGAPASSTAQGTTIVVREPYSADEKASTRKRGVHFELNRGMRRYDGAVTGVEQPAPVPNCSIDALWPAARAAGAPPDAIAIVRYDHSGWQLRIDGTGVDLHYDAGCQPKN